jgi:hypothetical protein
VRLLARIAVATVSRVLYGDILVALLILTRSRTRPAIIAVLITLQRRHIVASRRDLASHHN